MDKQEIIEKLVSFQTKLKSDVLEAYHQRGSAFGEQRFQSFLKTLSRFLREHLPQNTVNFDELFSQCSYLREYEGDAEYFWQNEGILLEGLIDSLILDVKDDVYDLEYKPTIVKTAKASPKEKSKNVFIVHGHNNEVKERTARFIQKLGFEPIILHEQASGGSTTIIEKILEYAKTTDFAIVLYTADDVGGIKNTEPSVLKPRARQNVVFEHGLLIGLLGRENVVPLVADNIEIPNDISGVVYVRNDWQTAIAKEMKKAGYEIDFNKLF
ncbi:conserved hypothetical protein [Shewanella baltica OS223]|uniref:TIR domain-containing protein n=1 Tax=Shewanella baltica TaxID=62322 RepID=UPI0001883ED2|nr:nucleotide-binding protein [Shewanella baltica]ACK47047.1 conserved hypothetical protein [Shewanella baltica OS223]